MRDDFEVREQTRTAGCDVFVLSDVEDSTLALMATQERLPQGENHEVLAEFFLGRLTNLTDALLRNPEFAGDFFKRGILEIITPEHAGVVSWKEVERSLD